MASRGNTPKSTDAFVSELQDVKRALIAFMLDTLETELNISPSAAGAVLLAPEDWDVSVSQDRSGIHVTLIDHAEMQAEVSAYRPPAPEKHFYDPRANVEIVEEGSELAADDEAHI